METNTMGLGKVVRLPVAPVRDAAPDDVDQLRAHPFVEAAYAEAHRLLEAARIKGTQRVAEAFASAYRDLMNQRLRAAGSMRRA